MLLHYANTIMLCQYIMLRYLHLIMISLHYANVILLLYIYVCRQTCLMYVCMYVCMHVFM